MPLLIFYPSFGLAPFYPLNFYVYTGKSNRIRITVLLPCLAP
jgi:hypothetical protein